MWAICQTLSTTGGFVYIFFNIPRTTLLNTSTPQKITFFTSKKQSRKSIKRKRTGIGKKNLNAFTGPYRKYFDCWCVSHIYGQKYGNFSKRTTTFLRQYFRTHFWHRSRYIPYSEPISLCYKKVITN